MRSEFSLVDGGLGKNVIIFRAHISSYVRNDDKGRYILILGEVLTQELDDTTLRAEAKSLKKCKISFC